MRRSEAKESTVACRDPNLPVENIWNLAKHHLISPLPDPLPDPLKRSSHMIFSPLFSLAGMDPSPWSPYFSRPPIF